VGVLKNILVGVPKTREIKKVTTSQDDGFVVEVENVWLGVQNTEFRGQTGAGYFGRSFGEFSGIESAGISRHIVGYERAYGKGEATSFRPRVLPVIPRGVIAKRRQRYWRAD
jgi:hypothetical protein